MAWYSRRLKIRLHHITAGTFSQLCFPIMLFLTVSGSLLLGQTHGQDESVGEQYWKTACVARQIKVSGITE